MPQKKKLPFVTVGFVAVNVLVYVILEILGNTENSEFMVRMGAVWPPYVKQGEYWRLFTATFMHFGFEHILNNMLVLICAGPILEKAMGHIKYLCLYLIAGVGGSTLSYVQMTAWGKHEVSAGASGAIFGIIGALLWIVMIHKGISYGQRAAFYDCDQPVLWNYQRGCGQLGTHRWPCNGICSCNYFIPETS